MEINHWMIEKIFSGKAILFLGAGASYGAQGVHGERPLSGTQLKDALADKFLGGEEKSKTLIQISDYAKHEAGLREVQGYIKTLLDPLCPADFHKIIPTFRWHSIFTTNYDLVIERAYERVSGRLQKLSPIIRDGDNFSEVISDAESVPYFKLHGCITTVNDTSLPLILASEEYAKHKNNRKRLFKHLGEFGLEHPIIFCGYQLGDPNIQQILFDLNDAGVHRPTYMLVDPSLGKYDIKMWAAQRVEPIKATFEEFLSHLDSVVAKDKRILSFAKSASGDQISKYLKSGVELTESLIQYLALELEHIYPGMSSGGASPVDFYKGLDVGWGGIKQSLDIKRRVTDQILLDSYVDRDISGVKSYLLKGHAGSGKSIILKRISWDAANDLSAPVFRLKEGAVLRPSLIKELALCCESRMILVVDDALSNNDDLVRLHRAFEYDPANVSIITSARTNEWNQFAGDLDDYISSEYEVSTLSQSEVNDLVGKLKHHGCLGNFKNNDIEDIKNYFELSADRQLLVALHEALSGKSFEEIVVDEYNKISPLEAKILYMDVCTLNRLSVPVRVGLISRISGIGMDQFRERFFSPLEHVVKSYMDSHSRDYVFEARHSLIAQLVFEHALKSPEEKANQIVRVLENLNIEYSADSTAFSKLIKGRLLSDVFGDKALALKIYNAAEKTGASSSYILHQKSVFELSHPGSDTRAALSAVISAEKALPEGRTDKAINHTKALVYLRLAKESHTTLEVEKFRGEARVIFERLILTARDSRPFSGLAELQLSELDSLLGEISSTEPDELKARAFLEQVKKVENTIYNGLQKFPNDEHLLLRQESLALKLNDSEKARKILEGAFKSNSSSEFVTVRLARQKITSGDLDQAEKLLRDGISSNPNSKPLHIEYAKLLISLNDESKNSIIEHHLKRSFSPGDSNYDAQFWYARHQYLYGDRVRSREIFANLKRARMSPAQKNSKHGDVLNSQGVAIEYSGHIVTEHVSFCIIKCIELGDTIYAHESSFTNLPSEGLKTNVDVRFRLTFTMRGPTACGIKILL